MLPWKCNILYRKSILDVRNSRYENFELIFLCHIAFTTKYFSVSELSGKLQAFLQNRTEEYYCQQDQRALQGLREGRTSVNDAAAAWAAKYSQVRWQAIFI